MNIEEAKNTLENSEAYKSWDKGDNYLCHVFLMTDKLHTIQFGYYSPEKDLITSFLIGQDKVEKEPESKAFKKPEAKIEPLNLEEVEFDIIEAIDIAEKLRKEKYPAFGVLKKIIVIQTIKEPTYNITLVTNSFETLNIKINAKNKEIISDQKISFASPA